MFQVPNVRLVASALNSTAAENILLETLSCDDPQHLTEKTMCLATKNSSSCVCSSQPPSVTETVTLS